ncbi:MAG: Thioesterase superfamily protein [candidate division Zixibacteria bacterium RBG-1]|nr:MAG: Thioesterase superfamily protein [candidate division Zixibacteria bacterium RBG-1]OGC83757.1 MAG: hypothetical protein A2V73_02290 [candidate division Zixibacteria bacterium RBG_19FT_COMBO_42_43]
MKEIDKYKYCFVCGDKNPNGLKVKFFAEGDVAKAEYVAGPDFQGYKDMFHGGILASLLDEVMIKAVIAKGLVVVTAGMEVAFKKPVRIGQKILLTGKMTEQKKRIILTEGEARLVNGDIVATASGKYFVADEKMKEKLQESLEKGQ